MDKLNVSKSKNQVSKQKAKSDPKQNQSEQPKSTEADSSKNVNFQERSPETRKTFSDSILTANEAQEAGEAAEVAWAAEAAEEMLPLSATENESASELPLRSYYFSTEAHFEAEEGMNEAEMGEATIPGPQTENINEQPPTINAQEEGLMQATASECFKQQLENRSVPPSGLTGVFEESALTEQLECTETEAFATAEEYLGELTESEIKQKSEAKDPKNKSPSKANATEKSKTESLGQKGLSSKTPVESLRNPNKRMIKVPSNFSQVSSIDEDIQASGKAAQANKGKKVTPQKEALKSAAKPNIKLKAKSDVEAEKKSDSTDEAKGAESPEEIIKTNRPKSILKQKQSTGRKMSELSSTSMSSTERSKIQIRGKYSPTPSIDEYRRAYAKSLKDSKNYRKPVPTVRRSNTVPLTAPHGLKKIATPSMSVGANKLIVDSKAPTANHLLSNRYGHISANYPHLDTGDDLKNRTSSTHNPNRHATPPVQGSKDKFSRAATSPLPATKPMPAVQNLARDAKTSLSQASPSRFSKTPTIERRSKSLTAVKPRVSNSSDDRANNKTFSTSNRAAPRNMGVNQASGPKPSTSTDATSSKQELKSVSLSANKLNSAPKYTKPSFTSLPLKKTTKTFSKEVKTTPASPVRKSNARVAPAPPSARYFSIYHQRLEKWNYKNLRDIKRLKNVEQGLKPVSVTPNRLQAKAAKVLTNQSVPVGEENDHIQDLKKLLSMKSLPASEMNSLMKNTYNRLKRRMMYLNASTEIERKYCENLKKNMQHIDNNIQTVIKDLRLWRDNYKNNMDKLLTLKEETNKVQTDMSALRNFCVLQMKNLNGMSLR